MQIQIKKNAKIIWNKIISSKQITICSHIDTDGDTIGSAIAMKELILENTDIKEENIKISGEKYPRYLDFLSKNDIVSDDFFNNSLKIVVDTSTPSRIFDKRVVTKESIKIDHHHPESEWMMEIFGDFWPATGEIIYEIATFLNLKMNKRFQEAIFVAIWTDTDGLTNRIVNNRTAEIIDELFVDVEEIKNKMKLNKEEIAHITKLKNEIIDDGNGFSYLLSEEHLPNDYLRHATSIFAESASNDLFISLTKYDEKAFRADIKTKPKIDASIIAKHLGGGGHATSAGFKAESLDDAKKAINYIRNYIKIL